MIYLEITEHDTVTFSNIQRSSSVKLFKHNESKKIEGSYTRSYLYEQDDILIWLIVENDRDLFRSTKLIKKTAKLYLNIFKSINNSFLSKVDSDFHTLKTIQAKMSQKMESIVEKQDFRAENYSELKNKIKVNIEKDLDVTSDVFCQIFKRINDINMHFEGLEILNDQNAVADVYVRPLKKTLLASFSQFAYDFYDYGMDVNFSGVSDDDEILIDNRLFDLAFHHFFHNASKYTQEKSSMVLTYQNGVLEISMVSRKIDNGDDIYKDGYSGESIPKELRGTGMGMSIIKRSLEKMDMDIEVFPGENEKDGYAQNLFKIYFNEKKIN